MSFGSLRNENLYELISMKSTALVKGRLAGCAAAAPGDPLGVSKHRPRGPGIKANKGGRMSRAARQQWLTVTSRPGVREGGLFEGSCTGQDEQPQQARAVRWRARVCAWPAGPPAPGRLGTAAFCS